MTRDVEVPCDNCGGTLRLDSTHQCADCGQFAKDPRYAYSKLTDTWYIVSDWEEVGDGKIQAKEKTPVDREDVPQEWIDAIGVQRTGTGGEE